MGLRCVDGGAPAVLLKISKVENGYVADVKADPVSGVKGQRFVGMDASAIKETLSKVLEEQVDAILETLED